MARGLFTDRAELEAIFSELATELAAVETFAEVVMVGGAWMLWHAHRASTRDVDSALRLGAELTEAVNRVGTRHDLRKGWLNDAAAAFWPSGVGYDECVTVFAHPALIVLTPSPEVIFVMKLYRADPQDREDLVTLWPLCSFTDAEDAAASFRAAYPHAPDDEYLASFIENVAIDARTD